MIAKRPWVILFGGAGREDAIKRLIEEGIAVAAVVVPKKQSEKLERAVQSLVRLNLPVVEVERLDLAAKLASWAGSGLISIGFPYLLSVDTLSSFAPALNVHPTQLPKYRGPTTAAYILINGESESGSTVHHMTENMDRGDIVAQSCVSLNPFDTVRSMQRKVYASEPDLILEAIRRFELRVKPEPQNEDFATEFPRRRIPSDSQIDPKKPLVDLINDIRAADPVDFPAFFYYQGEKVCIRLWRPNKEANSDEEI